MNTGWNTGRYLITQYGNMQGFGGYDEDGIRNFLQATRNYVISGEFLVSQFHRCRGEKVATRGTYLLLNNVHRLSVAVGWSSSAEDKFSIGERLAKVRNHIKASEYNQGLCLTSRGEYNQGLCQRYFTSFLFSLHRVQRKICHVPCLMNYFIPQSNLSEAPDDVVTVSRFQNNDHPTQTHAR